MFYVQFTHSCKLYIFYSVIIHLSLTLIVSSLAEEGYTILAETSSFKTFSQCQTFLLKEVEFMRLNFSRLTPHCQNESPAMWLVQTRLQIYFLFFLPFFKTYHKDPRSTLAPLSGFARLYKHLLLPENQQKARMPW